MREAKALLRLCTPHSKFPQTAAEWAEVLALQKQFHSAEVHKWRQILRASVELLDEVWPWGSGTLHSNPKMWHMPLGLRVLLYKMRKPFIVPHLPGLSEKSAEWKNLLAPILGKKSRCGRLGLAGSSHLMAVRIGLWYHL